MPLSVAANQNLSPSLVEPKIFPGGTSMLVRTLALDVNGAHHAVLCSLVMIDGWMDATEPFKIGWPLGPPSQSHIKEHTGTIYEIALELHLTRHGLRDS